MIFMANSYIIFVKESFNDKRFQNLPLGVGFLAAMLVFSMAAAAGAIINIIALPGLAQTDGVGGSSSSIGGGGGSACGGSTSTTNALIISNIYESF
jgi:hypothetical protein